MPVPPLSLVLTKKIRNHGRATGHYPELILNNFSTRLGHRVGRMFASVFPQKPGSRATRVTFHNQRDFIFFRHHRYIFEMRKGRRLPHTGHLATAEVPTEPTVKKRGRVRRKRRRSGAPLPRRTRERREWKRRRRLERGGGLLGRRERLGGRRVARQDEEARQEQGWG